MEFDFIQPITTLTGHSGPVNALTIISSTEYIVSGSDDKTIKVRNSTFPFQLIVTFEGHTYLVSSLAIIHSNENIMSGSWDKDV